MLETVYQTRFHKATIRPFPRPSLTNTLSYQFQGDFLFRERPLEEAILEVKNEFIQFLEQQASIRSPMRIQPFRCLEIQGFDFFGLYEYSFNDPSYQIVGFNENERVNRVSICQLPEVKNSRHILERFVKRYQR